MKDIDIIFYTVYTCELTEKEVRQFDKGIQ